MRYLFLIFLVGCSYNYWGMNSVDEKFTREGWTLHCTEVIENECCTRQWFNEVREE
jgi:hypothetical protein